MPFRHLSLVLLVICIWGFNFVVIKAGLGGLPPIFLCFSRFFLTSIPAVFFIKKPDVSLKMIAFYGVVAFALQFSFLFFAIAEGVSAGLASILLQLQAFFSLFLAAWVLKEKIQIATIIGGIVAFSGIGIVAFNLGGEISLLGLLLVLLAAFFWGFGSIVIKKIGKVDMTALVVWSALFAWPPLLTISLFFEDRNAILSFTQNPSWQSLGSVFYIGYFATAFAFSIWNSMLKAYPVSKVSPFTLLVPLIALLSSSLLLGEPLQRWKILSALFVVSGVCINLIGTRNATISKNLSVTEES